MNRTEVSSNNAVPHHGWQLAKRVLTLAFFILVTVLLVMLAKKLDWQEVLTTLRQYQLSTLLLATAITALSYLVYSSFDVLGRRYSGHNLPVRQIMPVTFVCYAFNLNLGAWVGGFALRYRLYSRLGLKTGTITQILSLSLVTNWLGYMLLAGVLFVLGLVDLPRSWNIGSQGLRVLGATLLIVSVGYLLLCALSKKRVWRLRGHEFTLPSGRLALTQGLLGASNWALMATIIYLLLGQRIDYPLVLGALLASSIAGAVTHIPAGLGVLEAVFVALLQDEVGKSSLLAALIAYRILYYLLPLAAAALVYLVLEARAKKLKQRNTRTDSTAARS
ncbi:MAG: lysylphosphatidylglycerol synthase domain-containing protein [Pseudomonadota bacterium]